MNATTKRFCIIWAAIAICMLLIAYAHPADLISDPNPGADRYRVLGLDPAVTIVPAEPDGSVKYSVNTLTPGPYNATIEAGAPYVLNGNPQPAVKWSTVVPFDLTVPDTPVNSSGLAIAE